MFKWSAFLILGFCATVCLLILSGTYDPAPISHYIKMRLEGKDPSDCLNLPEEMWRRFPQCNPELDHGDLNGPTEA